MSETKHAELPWEVSYTDTNGQRVIQGASSEICTCWHHCVVSLEEQMEANAEFICRAVNAHYDLLAACEALADHYGIGGTSNEHFEQIAAEFYRDTGLLAPGKDAPAAFGVDNREERRARFDEWNKAKHAEVWAKAMSAMSKAQPTQEATA